MINFQAVVKKRGLASFDELFKCYRQFPSAVTERFRKQSKSYSRAAANFRFSTKRTTVLQCFASAVKLTVLFVRKREIKLSDGTSRTDLQSLQSVYCGIRGEHL